ncbi:hypothetical protein E6O75_ATG06433 [Venturia nashicola]|uniref:Uncharacterized protein n=1 Tax=Venturia nashicola TaxID=86259 RepID=A0A4Z1NQP0_9PEZI|nr:hypothetical protein E6O75_ATG06433 [Venturia nashicola]
MYPDTRFPDKAYFGVGVVVTEEFRATENYMEWTGLESCKTRPHPQLVPNYNKTQKLKVTTQHQSSSKDGTNTLPIYARVDSSVKV